MRPPGATSGPHVAGRLAHASHAPLQGHHVGIRPFERRCSAFNHHPWGAAEVDDAACCSSPGCTPARPLGVFALRAHRSRSDVSATSSTLQRDALLDAVRTADARPDSDTAEADEPAAAGRAAEVATDSAARITVSAAMLERVAAQPHDAQTRDAPPDPSAQCAAHISGLATFGGCAGDEWPEIVFEGDEAEDELSLSVEPDDIWAPESKTKPVSNLGDEVLAPLTRFKHAYDMKHNLQPSVRDETWAVPTLVPLQLKGYPKTRAVTQAAIEASRIVFVDAWQAAAEAVPKPELIVVDAAKAQARKDRTFQGEYVEDIVETVIEFLESGKPRLALPLTMTVRQRELLSEMSAPVFMSLESHKARRTPHAKKRNGKLISMLNFHHERDDNNARTKRILEQRKRNIALFVEYQEYKKIKETKGNVAAKSMLAAGLEDASGRHAYSKKKDKPVYWKGGRQEKERAVLAVKEANRERARVELANAQARGEAKQARRVGARGSRHKQRGAGAPREREAEQPGHAVWPEANRVHNGAHCTPGQAVPNNGARRIRRAPAQNAPWDTQRAPARAAATDGARRAPPQAAQRAGARRTSARAASSKPQNKQPPAQAGKAAESSDRNGDCSTDSMDETAVAKVADGGANNFARDFWDLK